MAVRVAPSGAVTFLFTDIEGSTRRWEADADGMRVALDAHDGIPRDAVDAAIAAQRALALPVRMGIATGEAELRGADYFGPPLNRAARVMAAGHGGQILLADSTATLLSGVDLLELGPRRLRDLPMAIEVFQVRATGLSTDFPPLRALEASPGNLRPRAGSLIGRRLELTEVAAALRGHRLVTLTG